MNADFYKLGWAEAAARYGVGLLRRAGSNEFSKFREAIPGALQTMKQIAVGQPAEALKQFHAGTLLKPGGLLRDALHPMPPLPENMSRWGRGASRAQTVLGHRITALNLYNDSQAPPEQRGSSIGATAGSLVGGVLGQPLGMAGQLGGSMLLGNLGQSVGSLFDRKLPPPAPEETIGNS